MVERVRRGTLAYEDFGLATLLLSEVPREHVRPSVDELLAPLRANPPPLHALVEYFARDIYRLARVEKLLGRSLRQPRTVAELSLALLAD